jgi:signal transduction histidine kinase
MLLETEGRDESDKDMLGIIERSSNILLHIIEDILRFSEVNSGHPQVHFALSPPRRSGGWSVRSFAGGPLTFSLFLQVRQQPFNLVKCLEDIMEVIGAQMLAKRLDLCCSFEVPGLPLQQLGTESVTKVPP